jgi:very-short-patch-repair endonuclease
VQVRTTRDWRPGDLLWRDDVRVTNDTRVVVDLAQFGERPRRIENAIDSGIRRRYTSVPTLQRRITQVAGHGRRGAPLLRELMLDAGGESALERRFLRVMRNGGLPRPRTQVTYEREAGRAMRVDFQFQNGLVVEVSGRLGHTSDRDRQRDARRRNALQAQGVPFIEFTTADVIEDPPYVVATVTEQLS